MRAAVAGLLVIGALVLAAPAPALAHVSGKAEPRIAAAVSGGPGLERDITVRLTDLDSGAPVTSATVRATASMTDPHLMQTQFWPLSERAPGLYTARVRFIMPARWTLAFQVSGADVVSARSSLAVDVEPSTGVAPATGGPVPLPTKLDTSVTERDAVSIVVLWLHGLSALGWIIGVIVMAIALTTPLAAVGVRARLAGWYRRRGAWWHWALVLVVVGTGVYNMLNVTPFPMGSYGTAPSPFPSVSERERSFCR